MYAVIKTGGKQYCVQEGDVLNLEWLSTNVGEEVHFSEVLLVNDSGQMTCGTPFLKDMLVKAEVLEHGRHKKVKIIKFRRRKHYMKRMGHRQNYTQVRITAITPSIKISEG